MNHQIPLLELKSTGVKLTVSRKKILKVLSSQPLSAQEVFEVLKEQGIKLDLVTIYRNLDLFEKLGLIVKFQFEDHIARYEVLGENHHHHLICLKCSKLEHVEIEEYKILNQIKKKSSFQILRHTIEFYGFCQSCQVPLANN